MSCVRDPERLAAARARPRPARLAALALIPALSLALPAASCSPVPAPTARQAGAASAAAGSDSALAGSDLGRANLAAALAASGDLAGAEAALEEALESAPGSGPILAELARVRLLAGRASEAVAPALEAADGGRGRDPRYYLLATSARLRAGQASEAERDLARWQREHADAPLLRVSLGLLYESTGRQPLAEREYRAALERDPGCEEALSGLVKLAFERNDAQAALRAVRGSRTAGAAPKLWEAQALRRLGRLEEAEAPLRAALEAEPDHAVALAELGALCAARGDYTEARRLLGRALALEPDLDSARHNLARVERLADGAPHPSGPRP